MSNKSKTILGIAIEIESQNTGAPTNFHTINAVHVGYKYGTSSVTLDNYYSLKSYANGLQPLDSHTVILHGAPQDGECAKTWAYSKLIAPVEGGVDVGVGVEEESNVYIGAELVYAD